MGLAFWINAKLLKKNKKVKRRRPCLSNYSALYLAVLRVLCPFRVNLYQHLYYFEFWAQDKGAEEGGGEGGCLCGVGELHPISSHNYTSLERATFIDLWGEFDVL